jgi:hypothetical protein
MRVVNDPHFLLLVTVCVCACVGNPDRNPPHDGQALTTRDVIAIDVLLEPDATMAATAISANARFRERDPGGFALDADHVPHLTVLQRYVHRADVGKIVQGVAAVVARSGMTGHELVATGLYATSFAGEGMGSIRVTPTPGLLALQQALVAAIAPFVVETGSADAFLPEAGGTINAATVEYVRDFVRNSSGANYNPHVTVGIGDPAVVQELAAGPFTPFRFRVTSVGICQLGNFGTARRRLWSSGESSAHSVPQ